MPSVRHRGPRLPDAAAEDPSPVPAKRAKLSHKGDGQKAAKSLLQGGRLSAHTLDEPRSKKRSHFDESHAVVVNGLQNGDVDSRKPTQPEVVEVSSESDEEEDDEEDEGEGFVEQHEQKRAPKSALTNGAAKASRLPRGRGAQPDEGTEPNNDDDDDDEDDGAPTFGELAARDDPVDVEEDGQTALVPAPNRSLTAPNALTLTSVLTQSLRTNDKHLLESCLQLNDLESVRKTIERLPSPLISTLLRKLSERLHRRPGRAGNLLIWVQWSLVAHGGYLATQPDVVRKLQELSRVIKERAAALQPLLGLKGRLDMLAAQVELRKSAQAEQQAGRRSGEEDAVIYVEGDESSSSDDDEDEDETPGQASARRITARDDLVIGDAESSGDEAILVNGIGGSDDEDDEEDDEDDEDDEDLIDDEAEESDGDEEDEDDLSADDAEDEEMEGASDDEDDDRPATRRSAALRGNGFARR